MLYTATQILGKDSGEEAVHDIFVKLIEKFKNNEAFLGDKPAQYFVIIARNHSLNLLAKNGAYNLPLEEEFLIDAKAQPIAHSPEDRFFDKEAIEILASHIRSFPPAMRQILELRFIEGYSNTEIADMLGKSQTAVSTSINKARKRLKELLEREQN
jgi:RNA polymerase sigma-70 factor (ECF subfamily)